jgi:phage terminase small subunit
LKEVCFLFISFRKGGEVRMTARQERFCQEYSKTGNATLSAINAGYSEKTAKQIGQRLLTNVDLMNRIRELQGEIKNQNIIDARQMQEVLTSIIMQESQEEVIVVEGCGDGYSEAVTKHKTPSQSDRIKAIQLLARMQGVLDSGNTINICVPVFGGENDLEE